MTNNETSPATPELPAERARLVEEAKRLARQLKIAAFNYGVEDAGDAWTRQEKCALKETACLNAVDAAIDALAAAPTPASVQPLREPKPDDLLTVANIVQDGITLTLEINQLGDLVHLIGEDEATYQLHVTSMTRADFEDLGEFDGF